MSNPPGKSVFVSYCHTSQPFVRRDLVPVLRAAGVGDVFVDYERFATGKHLVGQMDHFQDLADVTLALVTPDYLASPNCMHEWNFAVGKDPDFALGSTIPVKLQPCTLPANAVTPTGPAVYSKLTDPTDPTGWNAILSALAVPGLGCTVPQWLTVRQRCADLLLAGDSVNLFVKTPGVAWKALLDSLVKDCALDLPTVNLESGTTNTRGGLLREILTVLGIGAPLPPKPNDCGIFEKHLSNGTTQRLAFRHFEIVREREKYYEHQLFRSLKVLQDARELSILFHSREPLASLVAAMPMDSRLRGIQVDL